MPRRFLGAAAFKLYKIGIVQYYCGIKLTMCKEIFPCARYARLVEMTGGGDMCHLNCRNNLNRGSF